MRITAEKDGFRIENGGGVPLIAELRLTAGFNGRKVEAKNWRSCGPDRFEAENGGIRFVESPCPDHTCESFGVLTKQGDWAACLPARASVTVE